MLPRTVTLRKEVGETPLQALERWRAAHPEYAEVPACYAGRLDPMAEGLLLVLLGDECKRQAEYHALDKEYEIEVLLGISTDTGDVLGMPHAVNAAPEPSPVVVRAALDAEVGMKRVPYPAFSSKTVNGKPLFLYALEGTLDTVAIPEHDETIHSIDLLGTELMGTDALREQVRGMLAKAPRSTDPDQVLGKDFRQEEIREAWEQLLHAKPDAAYSVLQLKVACGPGTYMRSLAVRLGRTLGTEAYALSINRTRIGDLTGNRTPI